jgi:hypothetical protein
LPKGDETICPHCGKSIMRNGESYKPTSKEIGKIKSSLKEENKKRTSLSKLFLVAISGTVMTFVGYGLFFLYPSISQANVSPVLLLAFLFIGTIGAALLFGSCFWFVYSGGSQRGSNHLQGFTISDAMKLGAGFPKWWKWWFNVLPMLAIILVGQFRVVPPLVLAALFFGYPIALLVYLYVSARKWVEAQDQL